MCREIGLLHRDAKCAALSARVERRTGGAAPRRELQQSAVVVFAPASLWISCLSDETERTYLCLLALQSACGVGGGVGGGVGAGVGGLHNVVLSLLTLLDDRSERVYFSR